MTRLACSDIHLNINRRLEDTESSLYQITELAGKYGVKQILVLGDIYHSRKPHSLERFIFAKWVQHTTSKYPNIEFVILPGNHDSYPDGIHSLLEFQVLGAERVKIVPNCHTEGGIFMGHLLLKDALIGTGLYTSEQGMTADELVAKYPNCKAYLLGDVHRHQVLKETPLVAYTGSIAHVDFAERNDLKGVIILNEKVTGEVAWEFVPLHTRPMVQYDVFPPYDLELPKIEGAIVKVIVNGTRDEVKSFDEQKLRMHLSQAKELSIEFDIATEYRARDSRFTETTSPLDALKQYVDNLEISEQEKTKVMELGREVMEKCRS